MRPCHIYLGKTASLAPNHAHPATDEIVHIPLLPRYTRPSLEPYHLSTTADDSSHTTPVTP